mmetsp:Transcript_36239/g.95927  ORF Transcript_36239/g.95927 Transcript_36239/m.95927 type:complete len:314 (-) Transcript_36239:217-1158(-)
MVRVRDRRGRRLHLVVQVPMVRLPPRAALAEQRRRATRALEHDAHRRGSDGQVRQRVRAPPPLLLQTLHLSRARGAGRIDPLPQGPHLGADPLRERPVLRLQLLVVSLPAQRLLLPGLPLDPELGGHRGGVVVKLHHPSLVGPAVPRDAFLQLAPEAGQHVRVPVPEARLGVGGGHGLQPPEPGQVGDHGPHLLPHLVQPFDQENSPLLEGSRALGLRRADPLLQLRVPPCGIEAVVLSHLLEGLLVREARLPEVGDLLALSLALIHELAVGRLQRLERRHELLVGVGHAEHLLADGGAAALGTGQRPAEHVV